ncbi:hypothetical protein BHE74_00056091 [Ensete ventricosum]|nr:hypothetical protein BHE74_00056091 [Ensete ventricosum]
MHVSLPARVDVFLFYFGTSTSPRNHYYLWKLYRQPEVISCRRGIGCVIVSRVHPASRTTFIRIIPGVRYDSNRFYHGYSAQRQLYIFPFLLSLCLTCLFYLSGTSVTLLAVMGSRYKKTGKVFPAGVVSLASLIMASGYLHGILRSSKTL